MGKIRLLPDALASQVAAGEVVERPASVVKELVENSIDAGARSIEIQVQRGGIALIRVIDDGGGMNRDDALMCVERHATSKIRTKEDLAAIGTLGFRGEALPSIASVSKFRLTTREPAALSGTEILINGGKMISVLDSGEPPGTQVEIRSLFFNIPARRKFLRTENTEFSHLEQQVRLQAIAHPEIRFALVRGEKTIFQLPPTKDLRERIGGLVGMDLAGRLLAVKAGRYGPLEVSGFIGPPGMGRSGRQQQLVFLNGRPVDSPVLNYALREGYHTALMKGQYPVTFLFLEMDPGGVDVNVHPAKKEVRFHDGNGVRDAVIEAIQATLADRGQSPLQSRETVFPPSQRYREFEPPARATETSPEVRPQEPTAASAGSQPELIEPREQRSLRQDWAAFNPPDKPQRAESETADAGEATAEAEEDFPSSADFPEHASETASPAQTPGGGAPKPGDFRLLGVLGKLYVLLESHEGLVLMDQHAAHERVLFEEMRHRMEGEGVPTQKLLMPLTVELPPKDFDLIGQNLEVLQKLGIGAEPFGANTLKIDSLPTFFKTDDPLEFMEAVIEELKKTSRRMSRMRLGEDMVATTVCRHAVKANDRLQAPELNKLLEDLLKCEMPYCCPHGRPTLIQISYQELERKFGRRV